MKLQFPQTRILIIGPIFKTKSGFKGQAGLMIHFFKKEGIHVASVSAIKNKIGRMIDTLFTIIFKRKQSDIILLQSFGLLAFVMEDAVSRLSKLFKKPIAFTLRGGAFIEFYEKHPGWVKKVLNRVDHVNTPSLFLKEKLEEKGFKITYLPNFIDFSNFQYKREVSHPHSLLWVRAFHDIYDPELAIETVRELKPKYPEVKLTMIGPDQGTLERCKGLIKQYDLENQIGIIGSIDNRELQHFYHQNKVFLTTTRYESFGNAIIESGACGIPCVSTNVGEIPYIWTDRENILLAKREANDFASKVSELFENEVLYTSISEAAHTNAKKYTWEKVQPLWFQTIDELAKRYK